MNRRLQLCFAVALLAVGAAVSRAASAVEAPAMSSDSSDSSHEKAARELVAAAGGAKMAESGADAMLEVVRKNSEMAPYEDVFRSWIKNVFASGDLEGEVAKLYIDAFTEEELLGIAAFYRSPVGQKAIARMPELMKKGAELGMRRAQEHMGELQDMLAAAKKQREGAKSPPP